MINLIADRRAIVQYEVMINLIADRELLFSCSRQRAIVMINLIAEEELLFSVK